MTNGEWLDYLAHNAPDELAAWFDAEHVETEERALDGDTAALEAEYGKGGLVGGSFIDIPEQGEVVMPLESWREYLGTESESEDSRERLEADVRNFAEKSGWMYPMAGTRIVLEWLDRQAAITAEETSNAWEEYKDATQREIAELTAERDTLQGALDIAVQNESKLEAERDELKAEHERIVQELVDANTRQCERTNELTAERDNAREESVELYSDLVKASDEREHYREKCSKMATIIHDALMVMDEGMA